MSGLDKKTGGEMRWRWTIDGRSFDELRDGFASAASSALAVVLIVVSAVAEGAPFVTPGMIRRNGLTDEQYEALWAMGRKPQIDQAAARDWIFRAGRYQNVTNWLDVCGKTNDFAKLSYKLQGDNFELVETNKVLVATNRCLEAACVSLADEVYRQWGSYTNQMAQTAAYSNLYVIVSGQAEAATEKIKDEIDDLESKIVKYREYQTKYPLLKKIFEAMITDAENRIKILQALTGERT